MKPDSDEYYCYQWCGRMRWACVHNTTGRDCKWVLARSLGRIVTGRVESWGGGGYQQQCSQTPSQDKVTRQPKCVVLRTDGKELFPMKKEKGAHEALSLLFHRDGVPNVMVMDGAKAQIQEDFRWKLREAGCHIKQTEPHTPKSNAAEGYIRELKRGVGREMVRYGEPKHLWDDCLIIKYYVRSSTALYIFSLEGQVPDTIVKGQTSDISPLADYAWYEWVEFQDTGQSFPD
jgi:hypothetical protein